MKRLLFILLMLVVGCQKDNITQSEQVNHTSPHNYMVLIDGMIDKSQLNRIGVSNSEGIVEFNEKKYFPTFYDTPIFINTDEVGDELGEFSLGDITDR